MKDLRAPIVDLAPWLAGPAGRYLLKWEQEALDRAVADVFGFHAVQLGHPGLDGLAANRMNHRWLAIDTPVSLDDLGSSPGDASEVPMSHGETHHLPWPELITRSGVVHCDMDALPFATNSLDLVVLPHTLDLSRDAHQTLNEVHRVLVPEGRVVILGMNPMSLWGLRQRLGVMRQTMGFKRSHRFVPGVGDAIAYHRLRDWLRLLSFEVISSEFGGFRPPLNSLSGLERFEWADRLGAKWWPVLGAVYAVQAVKRVSGLRLMGLAHKKRIGARAAPAVVVRRDTNP